MTIGALAGRVVLVTGSSRGIGAEVAVKAAAEGASVAVHYHRSADGARADRRAGAQRRRRGRAFAADIGDGGQAEALVRAGHRAVRARGRPRQQRRADARRAVPRDRAGRVGRGHPHRPDRRLPHLSRRAAVDGRARERHHRQHRLAARPDRGIAETAAYSAAKAGLIGLTRALAREFGPRGIRVNAVAPGVTITEMTTDLVDSEEGRRRLRDMPLGRFGRAGRGGRRGHLPAVRRVEPVPRPDAQPERRGLHAVSKVIDVREAVGLVRDGSTLLIGGSGAGHAVPQRFIDELAAVFARGGTAARPDHGPRRRHRRLRRPRLLAARPARAHAPDDRQQHRQRAAPRRARRGERDRVVLVPAGRAVAADARDRRGTAGARHAGRTRDVRRSAPDRRQAEREDDRGPRRGRHAPRPRVAALPRLPDRRGRHPGHDRRRGRQPDDGGRGRPGRDAGDGHGRPQQRRHRHRPGPPAGDARQPADARREGARRR